MKRTIWPALAALALSACAEAPRPSTAPAPPSAPAAPKLVHVQVLALNDFHGNLEPPHGHDGSVVAPDGERIPAGGAAYLAAHVRRLRAENPNTVLVSAGDLTGASPLVSNLFDDEPTVLFMDQLGLDFEAVGNHDFDRGLPELRRLQSGGPVPAGRTPSPVGVRPPIGGVHFRYLAANVTGVDGKTVFPAYAIRELAGVKVGFLGMTLEGTPSVTTHEATAGLTFASEAATANSFIPELRARGVATTVVMIHQGGFQDEHGSFDSCSNLTGDILPILRGLDPWFRVVVTGHTHQAYDCVIDGRVVTSAASYGRVVTSIDLAFDPAGRELVDVHARNVAVTHDIPPDPEAEKLVHEYEEKALPVTQRIVGYQRGPFTRDPETAHSPSCETPLGDLIADAQLAATRSAGAVLALMNPGGVRTDLVPSEVGDATPIRYAAAFEVQPFGNRLVTLSLTGEALALVLEHQFKQSRPRVLSVSKGFTYRYTYDAKAKTAVIDRASLRLAGRPIDPTKRYRVTVNSFLAEGGDGFTALRDAADRTSGPPDIEAFVSYLGATTSATHPVAPGKPDRVLGDACQ